MLTVIESEIIPRLRLAHREDVLARPVCSESRKPPTEAEIAELARIATCHDLGLALGFIEARCREGLSLEVLLLELVAGAARLLGEHWEQDLRTFNEVSAGLGTLQQLVHILGPSFAPALPDRGLVVLMPAPGEQHTLGLFLVAEFIRRAGWGVHIDPAMSQAMMCNVLEERQVVMLGISLSTQALSPAVVNLVAAARRATRNPRLLVMLGGSAELAELAATTGAQLATNDPREAVALLEGHPRVEASS
ncbi:MAG TPA: cobalamin-dependent protein [Myxococcaceae bacterium]|nr:cobalamin-dependent protein [Myxococcaceae bacterium]